MIPACLLQTVSAELFQHRVDKHYPKHGLTDNTGGRNNTYVTPLIVRRRNLLGAKINRGQGLTQRRNGLDRHADDDILIRSITSEPSPQLIHWWDKFWSRIKRMGMSDIAMRVGSAMATIGLVGLALWAMQGFFIGLKME